jgi:hypothetical protein
MQERASSASTENEGERELLIERPRMGVAVVTMN